MILLLVAKRDSQQIDCNQSSNRRIVNFLKPQISHFLQLLASLNAIKLKILQLQSSSRRYLNFLDPILTFVNHFRIANRDSLPIDCSNRQKRRFKTHWIQFQFNFITQSQFYDTSISILWPKSQFYDTSISILSPNLNFMTQSLTAATQICNFMTPFQIQ